MKEHVNLEKMKKKKKNQNTILIDFKYKKNASTYKINDIDHKCIKLIISFCKIYLENNILFPGFFFHTGFICIVDITS